MTPKSPEEILRELEHPEYIFEGGEIVKKTQSTEDWLRSALASVILWAAEETKPLMDNLQEEDLSFYNHLVKIAERIDSPLKS